MMNIQKMMQQAQQVQTKLQELQEKFKDMEVQGQSGGGLVTVAMNCVGEILSITIDPSIIRPDDKETLEDLIVAAVNNAGQAKDETIKGETHRLMQQLGLPTDAKLPF